MTLFLVQHGKAKPETEDPERSLTEQAAEDRRANGRLGCSGRTGRGSDSAQRKKACRTDRHYFSAKRLSPPKGVIAVKRTEPER